MNREQVMKDVVDHLVEQGEQALRNRGRANSMCVYREAKDGKVLKCAIGALIPDALYTPAMEGMGVVQLYRTYPALQEHFTRQYGPISDNDLLFLSEMQSVHDSHTGDWSRERIEADAKRRFERATTWP